MSGDTFTTKSDGMWQKRQGTTCGECMASGEAICLYPAGSARTNARQVEASRAHQQRSSAPRETGAGMPAVPTPPRWPTSRA